MAADIEDALIVRIEASLARFERQLSKGAEAANRTSKGIEDRFRGMNTSIQQSSSRAAGGMMKVLNTSRQGRFVLQNTAAQFGDLAVQIGAGTNPMISLGQQVPQLLGGFAALGGAIGVLGPAMATVAAVGFPLALFLSKTGQEAEEAQERIDKFTENLGAAEAAIQRSRDAARLAVEGGYADLRAMYGGLKNDVTELAEALADIEAAAAKNSLAELLGSVVPDLSATPDSIRESVLSFEEYQDKLQDVYDTLQGVSSLTDEEFLAAYGEQQRLEAILERLLPIREQVLEIADAYNLNNDEAARLLATIYESQNAIRSGDYSAAADGMAEARDMAEQFQIEVGSELFDAITRVEARLREMIAPITAAQTETITLSGAFNDLPNEIKAVIDSANSLVSVLERAVGLLASVAGFDFSAVSLPQGGLFDAVQDVWGNMNQAKSDRVVRMADLASQYEQYGIGRSAAEQWTQAGYGDVTGGVAERPERPKSSGGMTPSKFIENAQAEVEALKQRITLIGKEGEELQFLQAKYRLIEAAKARNLNLDEVQAETGRTLREEIEAQAEAIGRLSEQYDQAAERAEFFNDLQENTKDGLLDAIVAGEGFVGVLQDLAKALAKAALEAALFGSGPMGGGLGGGLVGDALAAIFGGFRANGGTVSSGKGYVVGERGPEPFFPAVNGRIISNSEAKAAIAAGAANGSAGGISMSATELTLSDGGQIMATVRAQIAQNNKMQSAAFPSAVRKAIRNPRVS